MRTRVAFLILVSLGTSLDAGADLPWRSPNRYRQVLGVDFRGRPRSHSPVTVDLDLERVLAARGIAGTWDEETIEVIAYNAAGDPAVCDASREGYERYLLPWRIQRYYGTSAITLSFAVPDDSCATCAVYWDTVESSKGSPQRYRGLVGDGDFFREERQRREIGASHFDAFADLDGDGDLDLFRGGVEPFVYCFENVGGNRFVDRGRLTSGGDLLTLPMNPGNHRSWIVPHFFDLDRDGDLDFFPSFTDGPQRGRIVFFENTTDRSGEWVFVDRGPLMTASGTPIAGKEARGGWFPSVVFVEDFDGDRDGRIDLIVGSNHRCFIYRGAERSGKGGGGGWRWTAAEPVRAGGEEIVLFNPCFEVADTDGDGDRDLLAASQAGQIILYQNIDATERKTSPEFAAGIVVAYDETYTMRSTHPRVTVADFTGDGRLDAVVDRAWELADLANLSAPRDYGSLFRDVRGAGASSWPRSDAGNGAPFTEDFPFCDALRQNVVRAVDWNSDGHIDLLAGDCDGFIWYFENRSGQRFPLFATGRRLRAGGELINLVESGGHARPDVCDFNGDGRRDLVVADGAGRITVYLDEERAGEPKLGVGRKVLAYDEESTLRPIDRGTRSHVLACDWNGDAKIDLVFSDQENPGFYLFQNVAEEGGEPRFARAERLSLTPFVRPNLGSFVDWDGDGKKDLIACEFEHTIRLYRNIGESRPGSQPRFADPDGTVLVRPFSIMMISGADVVDFNGDGDLDIITGQGHGGSGLRFFERDYIEDCIHSTHPRVEIERFEEVPVSFLDVVRGYADAMIEHGRDTHGEQKSGLFLSALDRFELKPLEVRPVPPGGIRRGDRAGLPWLRLAGANPQLDENFLRVLYSLSEITGEARFGKAADRELRWFFENTQSVATGLLPWGEHLSWDVFLDRPVSSGTDLNHEFARPWVLWDRSFVLAPAACRTFALGVWNHQIADHETGAFDRHAPYDRHGPRDGKDFPRHAGFYIQTWAHAYRHTRDETFLRAIETLIARFEAKRTAGGGQAHSTLGPLDVETAATMVPEPLAERLRRFAAEEDRLVLSELRALYGRPGGGWDFPPSWEAAYAVGTAASWAMFSLARHEQVGREAFRDIVVAVAVAYRDELPAEDVDLWPMSLSHVISAQVAAYRMTGRNVFLEEAQRFARLAVRLFWQDRPLPRASAKTDHYETITGCDSLALSLLEVDAVMNNRSVAIPSNTIDR